MVGRITRVLQGLRGRLGVLGPAGVIMLAVTMAWPATAAALSLSGIKSGMIEFLIEKISVPGKFELAADLVENNTEGGTTLHGVQVSDRQGVWFEAERFVLLWRAKRLLRGEVQIDELGIHGGRLQRLPVFEEDGQQAKPAGKEAEAEPTAGGWPRSPITFRVDKLEIRDMRVPDTILPQAIAFDANGGMQDEGDTQSLILSLKRADRVRGNIRLSYLKKFDTDVLNLRVDAREGPGGLVAAAAGLPPEAPTEFKLNGAGTPADWKGELQLALAEMLDAGGKVSARWHDRIGVDLEVGVIPGPRLSPAVRAAIGARGELDVEIDQGEGTVVEIKHARLESDSVDAEAEGRYDRESTQVEMELTLAAKDEGAKRLSNALSPAGFDQGEFSVQVKGPAATALISGRSELQGLRYQDFGAPVAKLDFRMPLTVGELSQMDLVAEQPYGPSDDYAVAFGDRVTLGAKFRRGATVIEQFTAELNGQHLAGRVEGEIGLRAPVAPDLSYQLHVSDVHPFAKLSALAASGGLQASGKLWGETGNLQTEGSVALSALVINDQQLGEVEVDHRTTLLTEAVDGSVELAMRSPQYGEGVATAGFRLDDLAISLNELKADLLSIKVNGKARLPRAVDQLVNATGDFDLVIESLSPVAKVLGLDLAGAGSAEVSVEPAGSGTGVITGRSELKELRYQAFGLPLVTLDISVPLAEGEVSRIALVAQKPFGPTEDFAAALGDRVTMQVGFKRAAAAIEELEADLRGQHLSSRVEGRVGLGGSVAPEISYRLGVSDLQAFAKLGGLAASGGLEANGRVSGEIGNLQTEGSVGFSELVVNEQKLGRVQIAHQTTLTEAIDGSVELTMRSPDYGDGAAGSRFRFDDTAIAFDELKANLLSVKAEGKATVPRAGDQLVNATGEFDLEIDSLSPVGKLVGLTVAGAGSAHISVKPAAGGAGLVTGHSKFEGLDFEGYGAPVATLDLRMPLAVGEVSRLDLVAERPYGPNEDYAAAFGDSVVLGAEFSRAASAIEQLEADLRGQHITSRIEGRVGTGGPVAPDLSYRLVVADLRPFARLGGLVASGGLRAIGKLAGEVGSLDAEGSVAFSELVVNEQPLGEVEIAHRAKLAEAVDGSVKLTMRSPVYGDGSAGTAFRLDDTNIAVTDLEADLLDIKAFGKLTLPRSAADVFGATGEVDLDIDRLSSIGKVLGVQLAGAGSARLLLEPAAKGTAKATAQFNGFKFDQASLRKATLNATVTGLSDQFDADAQVEGAGFTHPQIALSRFEIQVKGPMAKLDFDAAVVGTRADQPLLGKLAGTSDWAAEPKTVQIEEFRLSLGQEAINLRQPAQVRIDEQRVELDSLLLGFPDDGVLAASLQLNQRYADIDLRADSIPVRLAHEWFGGPPLTGTLSIEAAGQTGGDSPQLRARAAIDTLSIPKQSLPRTRTTAAPDPPSVSVSLDANWDGRELASVAQVSTDRLRQPLKATVNLPMVPGDGPAPRVVSDGRLRGAMDWRGSVAPLFALAPLPDDRLEGQLAIDIDIAGTVSNPRAGGAIRLIEGRYENLLTGTQLRQLDLDAQFPGNGEVTARVTATDGAEGKLNVDAATRLEDALEALDVRVAIDELLVVRLDAATAAISSRINARGKPGGLTVSGETTIDRGEIRLLNPFPPSVVDVGPIIVDGDDSAAKAAAAAAEPSNVELDLKVSFPGDVFVRGRGLDSEWKGDLSIAGTSTTPEIAGSIEKVRGNFNLLSKPFDLNKGRVMFDRGRDLDPDVDVELVREDDDITGVIQVNGRASDPQIKFTSRPALPEDEVLPRVLFGRSKQSLSGAEALQLAAGVATLTRGQAGVLDKTRENLGVDVLRLEGADSDDEDSLGSLKVGKYVAEDIFVGAKQPLGGEDTTSVFVEYNIIKNVILDAEFSSEESKGGARWRLDF